MQMEPPRRFAFLGPRVRIVERMVQNIPLPHHHLLKRKPPEIEQFRADPERIQRDRHPGRRTCGGATRFTFRRTFQLPSVARLGQAHRRLVNSDNRNIREFLCQVQRTFAGTATGIEDQFNAICTDTVCTHAPCIARSIEIVDELANLLKRLASMVRHRAQKSRGSVLAHHGF